MIQTRIKRNKKGKSRGVYLENEIIEQLNSISDLYGISGNEIIRSSVREGLKQFNNKNMKENPSLLG